MPTTYTNGQFVGSSLTNLEGELLRPGNLPASVLTNLEGIITQSGNLPASVLTNLEGFLVRTAAPFEFEVRASLIRKQSWK